ncbi:hypothetical protein SUGI_0834870 [Cryptomeria japonica]|nr:hypothetical protein SUGI_0834870 [Cryptomeria japonica]
MEAFKQVMDVDQNTSSASKRGHRVKCDDVPNGHFVAVVAFTTDVKVFPIPLHDEKGCFMHYDRLSISPNDKIIAASYGPILQWLSLETGEVLDTVDKAHDAEITCMAWSPQKIATENVLTTILATCGNNKKVKLWATPKSLLH